jgi:hypothetical protein
LFLTLISSFLLVKGTFNSNIEDIAKLASTGWGYNLSVARNLSEQQADTKVGFWLLLLSFVLQTVNSLWPMAYQDFEINKNGLFLACVVSIIIFMFSVRVSISMANRSFSEVKSILENGGVKKLD